MRKDILCVALGALLLAISLPVEAQQPGKVYRIGYLGSAARGSFAESGWNYLRKSYPEYRGSESFGMPTHRGR
jgi:hypothetical protein